MILGSRGSDLALWQTRDVSARLLALGTKSDIKIITTSGDVSLAERLVGSLEKGFFTAELEAALRSEAIDAAVHSLKDLPTRLPEGLSVGSILPRANAYDILLTHERCLDTSLLNASNTLPLRAGTRVGASSLRRDALVKHFAPSLRPVPLRGNVPTRLQKLRQGDVDAIILAGAGVQRLQLDLAGLVGFSLNPRLFVPAPGQGAVAVETRTSDARAVWAAMDDQPTRNAVSWERALLAGISGGCATPFGAYLAEGRLSLGQATPTGWQCTELPHSAVSYEEGTQHAWVQQTIKQLAASPVLAPAHVKESSHDNWLFRPL